MMETTTCCFIGDAHFNWAQSRLEVVFGGD